MSPEEVVLQLKKNGTFDELRKRLLSEFQNGEGGQKFLDTLKLFMEEMVAHDPTLIEKESSSFYDAVSNELERAGVYNTIRQDVLGKLKGNYYQTRVDEEVRVVTEKADK